MALEARGLGLTALRNRRSAGEYHGIRVYSGEFVSGLPRAGDDCTGETAQPGWRIAFIPAQDNTIQTAQSSVPGYTSLPGSMAPTGMPSTT
jgi:hypothetical protein